MTTRILPREEYPRLEGTEAELLWPHLPAGSQVVVVEDDAGAIAGCWTLIPTIHAECLWIAPTHRKLSVVLRRLLRGMFTRADEMGAPVVVTSSISDEVTRLLEHFGATELPGRHFTMAIPSRKEPDVCPSQ